MNALIFKLHLLQPVLATQPESGEENSATAFGFIPGSMIRGALIAEYARRNFKSHLATDTTARKLFFDGSVRFLNAYPWHSVSKARMLPRPHSWFTPKDQASKPTAEIWDLAVTEKELQGAAKNPSGEFCILDKGNTELHTLARQVNVHNASDDPIVKSEDTSTVYRYDAIAPDQVLSCAIVAEQPGDLVKLKDLLKEELVLGGSHTASYGRVHVLQIETENDWQEYVADTDLSGKVIVTLLSDTIIRSSNGQVDGNLDQAIASALGLISLEHKGSFQRMRLVGGFNRKAGLPLPQSWAIQAGSVFVYSATEANAAALRLLAEKGIGERRAEGFGCFAVNMTTREKLDAKRYVPTQSHESIPLSEESKELARVMAQRRLRTLLENKLIEAVNGAKLTRVPENAQLSRVRTSAQQALVTKNLDEVITLMKGLKAAKKQFERARVDNEPMLEWILARASQKDIEEKMKIGTAPPRIAGQLVELSPEMKVEYTARMIDAMMKKAIKQNQKELA